MPIKSQQRAQTDAIQMLSRKTTMSTMSSKTAGSILKQSVDLSRSNSSTTGTSRERSSIAEDKLQESMRSQKLQIITEVDETNIDEILNSPDLSSVPTAFITEIQQDQVYETILQELQKKVPHRSSTTSSPPLNILPEQEEEQRQQEKPLSPILLAETDNKNAVDDNANLIDESSSSTSSENNPSLSHDDYDTDIESEVIIREDHDLTGIAQYRELCLQSKIVPCSYFMAHIQDKEMILRYRQFSTDDVRAIAKTLCSNLSIERLCLDGNYLRQQAAKYICRMIVINDFITELSLADNYLGGGSSGEGIKEICKMLTLNRFLKKINLSGNKFNDIDATQLVEAFEKNKILRELDLSHNCFGEDCGRVLGAFISSNDSLESIDLSWNNIRRRSAIDIAHGIKENVRLKRCNLEMNGFGPEGGQILGDCIKHNEALEEFNINGNRLNTLNAFAIAQGLLSNDSLEVLKIADNQINSDGALAIFLAIKANESSKLREVDFTHTVITHETLNICEDIVKIKDGKFRYAIGKVTPQILQPNSISECYTRTDEEFLNRLRLDAANAKSSNE